MIKYIPVLLGLISNGTLLATNVITGQIFTFILMGLIVIASVMFIFEDWKDDDAKPSVKKEVCEILHSDGNNVLKFCKR